MDYLRCPQKSIEGQIFRKFIPCLFLSMTSLEIAMSREANESQRFLSPMCN